MKRISSFIKKHFSETRNILPENRPCNEYSYNEHSADDEKYSDLQLYSFIESDKNIYDDDHIFTYEKICKENYKENCDKVKKNLLQNKPNSVGKIRFCTLNYKRTCSRV